MSTSDSPSSPTPEKPARFWRYGALALCLAVLGPAFYTLAKHPRALVGGPELSASAPATANSATAPAGHGNTAEASAIRPLPPRPPATQPPIPAPGWVLTDGPTPPFEPGARRAFVTYGDRDIYGGDYAILKDVDLERCEDRCKSDSRCRAYTFNKWASACFLKSSVNVARLEPRGISGSSEELAVDQRPPAIQRSRARRFPGEAYRTLRRPDYDGCASACVADAQCLGFNFTKAERSCALIAALDRPVPGNGTDAGMKLQIPPNASAGRRRAPPARSGMPPEAAFIFDAVVRQLMRY